MQKTTIKFKDKQLWNKRSNHLHFFSSMAINYSSFNVYLLEVTEIYKIKIKAGFLMIYAITQDTNEQLICAHIILNIINHSSIKGERNKIFFSKNLKNQFHIHYFEKKCF